MKPEATRFVDQANIMLARAEIMLRAGPNEDAARAAYLAGFHAAQASSFERVGRIFKTHRGVQKEFFQMVRKDPRADQDLRRFLSQAYEFKSIADYFSGPDPVTPPEEASEAIQTAKHFVAHFVSLVDVAGSDMDDAP